MNEIIERLKSERYEHKKHWMTKGKECAKEVADTLTYAQLRGYAYDLSPEVNDEPWEILPKDIQEEIDQEAYVEAFDSPAYGLDKDAFAKGFIEGIKSYWNEIAEKLN